MRSEMTMLRLSAFSTARSHTANFVL